MENKGRNWTLVAACVIAIAIVFSAVYLGSSIGQTTRSSVSNPTGSSAQTSQVAQIPSVYGSANQLSSDSSVSATASRSISVSGTGSVSFVPTEALVSVSVVTQEATAEAATASNSVLTLNVIKALNSIGISNNSIQTSSYNLSPNYNYNGQQPPTIVSYTVTNSLQVNVTGTGANQLGVRAGQVIDTAVTSGANQVSLQFTAPNYLMVRLSNVALHNAILVASSQAQVIASSLGVTLGVVLAASTGSSYYPQTSYAPGAITYTLSTTAAASTPIVPGTLTLTATVQVTFAIS